MPRKPPIALDFDGVINSYKSGFVAINQIPDPPVPGALDAIRNYIDNGLKVHIYSTRCNSVTGLDAIRSYLSQHGLEKEYIDQVSIKSGKPIAILYVDDRGYQFTGNNWPTPDEIKNFTPWTKRKSSTGTQE